MKKRILILGNTAKAYALGKILHKDGHEIYALSGNDGMKEFAECIDIRDNSTKEILEFVLENTIDMTIPLSDSAWKSDITDVFNNNNAAIFSPNKESYKIVSDKAYCKKLLYRLKIPTPKFGIFDKQNMAFDYLKNQKEPFVIKTNDSASAVILTSVKSAKNIIESVFAEKNNKIIIEDYVWGHPFAFYTLTDGFKAIPIGSSIIYKHVLEGDGGQLTSGMGACSPDYKLSFDNEEYIMNNVIYPALAHLEAEGNPYVGILGVNGILTETGEIKILGFQSFMQDCDCAGIFNLVDGDIYSLFESCIIGSFSDEVDFIPQKNLYAVSVALNCRNTADSENVITGLDNIDSETIVSMNYTAQKNKYLEYEAKTGIPLIITSTARNVSSASERAYNELKNIDFKGISYRKDICNSLNKETSTYC